MNFKIYVQNGLENSISYIKNYDFTSFNSNNFSVEIHNHLASKISQCFLFFVTSDSIKPIHELMSKHGKSKFQFVIIGSKFNSLDYVPLSCIMDIKRKNVSKDDLLWYFAKFDNIIEREKLNINFSDRETRDIIEDQNELISIGQLLAKERDRDKLIKEILLASIKITGADAGCVFLVVNNPDGSKGLLFKYSYTFSRQIDFNEYVMPMNEKSIAGFCAVKDEVINIPDVYNIPESAPFSFNRSIDEKYNYISRSMLVFPMKNHLGEMHGVIQLINSKESYDNGNTDDETETYKILLETRDDFYTKVFPFAFRYEDLMLSVAGQASIALDNIKMIQQLEQQFEGMVRASVDAIDSKDPATSGHSFRVAKMSMKFLEAINSITSGEFALVKFNSRDFKQMEYAALLHDYGKVYIDNDIFLKAKKLFPKDFSILMLRIDLIIQSLKNMEDSSESRARIDKVLNIREKICSLNEPRIFHENPEEIIEEILAHEGELIVYDGDGNVIPLLTDDEIKNLQIGKGSLNSQERQEIESHVNYTYNFLQSIPWPKDLYRIPEIAGGHHEMLNGTGYPNKLTKDELCVESRILAILDIFDALSASDRPYKKPVPFSRVKSILLDEGKKGRLDKGLLEIFFKNKIYGDLYEKESDSVKI